MNAQYTPPDIANWFASQQQLWQNWMNSMTPANDWANISQQWQSHAGHYFKFAEWSREIFSAKTPDPANWQAELTTQLEKLKDVMSAAPSLDWFKTNPLFNAATLPFASMFSQQSVQDAVAGWQAQMEKFLSIPAVGPMREAQEEWQSYIRAQMKFQQVLQESTKAQTRLNRDAVEELRRKLITMGDKGEVITTLRALYDLFVDSAEEVYARYAMSTEYQQLYARLAAAAMSVKEAQNALLERFAAQTGMPTRRELDTMHQREYALKRKLAALETKVDAMTVRPASGSRKSGKK